MTDHLRELLTWLATGSTSDVGSTLTALRSALKWASALAITLIYRHYLAVLGGSLKGEGTPKRQAYDDMRHSLAHGNWAARVYAVRLTRFLNWIDGFSGDAGITDRTLFPHAFGLRTPAPRRVSHTEKRSHVISRCGLRLKRPICRLLGSTGSAIRHARLS